MRVIKFLTIFLLTQTFEQKESSQVQAINPLNFIGKVWEFVANNLDEQRKERCQIKEAVQNIADNFIDRVHHSFKKFSREAILPLIKSNAPLFAETQMQEYKKKYYPSITSMSSWLKFKVSDGGIELKNQLTNLETVREGDIFTELTSEHFKHFAEEWKNEADKLADTLLDKKFQELQELYEQRKNQNLEDESYDLKNTDALQIECVKDYEKQANKIFSRVYTKHAKNLLTEFKSAVKQFTNSEEKQIQDLFNKIDNKYKNGKKTISVEELIEASIRSIQEIEVDEDIAAPMQNFLV